MNEKDNIVYETSIPFDSKSHGKFEQLKEIKKTFSITDEQLEEFLSVNFKHLDLKRGENQDEDVSLISWYTSKKFIVAIDIFSQLYNKTNNEPYIIPYIKNIVNQHSERIDLHRISSDASVLQERMQPPFFKGNLYPPQASLLKRMLDIETEGISLDTKGKIMVFHGGIVNERLSFGKTFSLSALICARFLPYESKEPNLINTNLIVCGTKVAKEWKTNLKNLTILDALVIERNTHLDELEKRILNNDYPQVIVVKDGDITWKGKKNKALNHVFFIVNQSDHRDCWRWIDDAQRALIVQGDIAACYRRSERTAGFGHAFNGFA